MKTYHGERRRNGTARIYVCTPTGRRYLRYRSGPGSHSPTGFEWGYGGSGPAETARAMAIDVLGKPLGSDPRIYQALKWRLVAGLPRSGWTITELEIRQAVDDAIAESAARGDAW